MLSIFKNGLFFSLAVFSSGIFGAHTPGDWQKRAEQNAVNNLPSDFGSGDLGLVEVVQRPRPGDNESDPDVNPLRGDVPHCDYVDGDEEEKLTIAGELFAAIADCNVERVKQLLREKDVEIALKEVNGQGQTPEEFLHQLEENTADQKKKELLSEISGEFLNCYGEILGEEYRKEEQKKQAEQIQWVKQFLEQPKVRKLVKKHLDDDTAGLVMEYLCPQWIPTKEPIKLRKVRHISTMVTSPDGNYAVFLGYDKKTYRERLAGHAGFPQEKCLVILNMKTHEKKYIPISCSDVLKICFSPNWHYLAVISPNGNIVIYKTPKRFEVNKRDVDQEEEQKEEVESENIANNDWQIWQTLECNQSYGGAFSPDGKKFVVFNHKDFSSAGGSELLVYDVQNWKQNKNNAMSPTTVSLGWSESGGSRSDKAVLFSPNGDYLVVSTGLSVHVFETKGWTSLRGLWYERIAYFYPQNNHACVSGCEMIGSGLMGPAKYFKVDITTGKIINELKDPNVWFSLDGRYQARLIFQDNRDTVEYFCTVTNVADGTVVLQKSIGTLPVMLKGRRRTQCIFSPAGNELMVMLGEKVYIFSLVSIDGEEPVVQEIPDPLAYDTLKKNHLMTLLLMLAEAPYAKIAKGTVAVWAAYKAYQNRQRVAQWLRQWR